MHRTKRERLLRSLKDLRAAAVVFSGATKLRNGDSQHRFRPGSDFWYLSGFDEPDAVLVLRPDLGGPRSTGGPGGPGGTGDDDRGPATAIFVPEKNRQSEVWTGRRLGVEAAPTALAFDAAFAVDELWQRLPQLLAGYERIVYRSGENADRDRSMLELCRRLRELARGAVRPPLELVDPSSTLHEQRLIKNETEIAAMRRAAEITGEAHRAAMRAVRPGVGEHEIDALLEYTFRRHGSTGPAYTNIVAGGANACVLHYVKNDQPLRAGELLLVDAGCEWQYYASDVTRTFPVDGRFDPTQRAIYETVLTAQKRAIASVAPGTTLQAIHDVALRSLVQGLVDLGLLEGDVETALEAGDWRRFYMHRTSHWLGLDVHDCGGHTKDGQPRRLEPGMVLTVEPGLYIDTDETSVEERWRGLGVRIEDDVLVTEQGCEVLTADIPKEVDALEAICAEAAPISAPAGG